MDEYIAIAKEKHGYNMEQVTTYLEKLFMLFAFLYRIVWYLGGLKDKDTAKLA